MDFLAAIGTALTAGGTGGLLGILGSVATGWMKTRASAVELEREKLRFEHKMALLRFQAEKAAAQADLAALAEALKAEGGTNNERISPIVADIKSLWRPALTLLLLLLTSWIFYAVLVGDLVLEAGTPKAEIISKVATGIIFLANLSVAFWFGSRGVQADRTSR